MKELNRILGDVLEEKCHELYDEIENFEVKHFGSFEETARMIEEEGKRLKSLYNDSEELSEELYKYMTEIYNDMKSTIKERKNFFNEVLLQFENDLEDLDLSAYSPDETSQDYKKVLRAIKSSNDIYNTDFTIHDLKQMIEDIQR